MKIVFSRTVLLGVCFILLFATTVLAGEQPSPARSQKAKGATTRIGQFTIQNPGGTLVSLLNRKTGFIDFDLRGPNVKASSARYDLAARRIVLQVDPKAKGTSLVRTGEMTGNVQIEIREPEQQRVTVLTAERATWNLTDGKLPTRIRANGNVRVVYRGPSFGPEPFIVNGTTALVEFLNADETRITVDDLNATGTPLEKAN